MARRRNRRFARYEIFVRPKAAEDLDAIFAYIAADSPSDAERFLAKLLKPLTTSNTRRRRIPSREKPKRLTL